MSKIFFNKSINRTWDWLSIVLLVLLMGTGAARLAATLWTRDLSLVLVVTFIGTLLGLLLGKSIFRRFWMILFAIFYGVFVVCWQLGLTMDPDLAWRDRMINLWGRLGVIIQEVLTKKPVTDSLLFLLLMALLFWVLAVYAGVVLVRQANPWKVVIPMGITAFVINTFDPLLLVRSLYLAVYLLIALILVARLVYLNNNSKWNQRHAYTPSDMGFEISRVALVLSMILVFFAWNLPVIADTFRPVADLWHTTSQPWLSLKDRFSFMFASLSASATTVNNFYSSTLPLGLGSPLSDQVVMEVQAPTNPPAGTRYYWEARTYDTYKSDMWSSTLQTSHNLTVNSKDLPQPGVDVRAIVTFTFSPYENITNIYTVPEALWTSLPTQAFMNFNNDGTVNYSALIAKNFVRPGEQYTVRSALDSVTVKQLRDAGTSYPSWVSSEYLQLPEDITPRTKQLAQSIASELKNPYDIANAVTNYLRANIQYDLTISKPPANQERIDWFLFDYQKGFCNYYASAEVILLRSLGIPARMAVGFAEGQAEANPAQPLPSGASANAVEASSTSTFVVRQNNAHAWPEVYFPNIGWVIFEPTAAETALSRPSGEDVASYGQIETGRGHPVPTPQELGSERELAGGGTSGNSGAPTSFWTTSYIILFVLAQFAIGILIILIWQYFRGFRVYAFLEKISIKVPETMVKGLRQFGLPPPTFLLNWIYYLKLPIASRSYLEINHALERLGEKPEIHATPAERTAELIKTIPDSGESAQSLLVEYQNAIYSSHPVNLEIARLSANKIRNLSWREWLNRYLSRLTAIFHRSSDHSRR